MDVLTLDEAKLLMFKLRARCSELCKLRLFRHREWYAEHPEVATCTERIHQLQDMLGEDCFVRQLTPYEGVLLAELKSLAGQLSFLPKCPDGLSASEDQELRDAMSQAERLRRRLPSNPKRA